MITMLVMARAFSGPTRQPIKLQRSFSVSMTPPNTPNNSPIPPNYSRDVDATMTPKHVAKNINDLNREVLRLRKVIGAMSGALLFCDDMALRERELLTTLSLYADLNFSSVRSPALLRETLNSIMHEYSIEPTPLPRKWKHLNETMY